jgi:deoxyribodipyrimidine photo-lyase
MSTPLMKSKRIIVWFRNDLRLHDNEMLVEAIAKSDAILPVYFFDPRHFDHSSFHQSSVLRTNFLLESVAELRQSFQKLGGDLLIIHGLPEDHIAGLVEEYGISEVYHHREVAPAETLVSANVEDRLWKIEVNLKHFIGHTLYNKEDLPFPIKDIPDVFTQFRKKTERDAIVKSCFDAPVAISFVPSEEWGLLPTVGDLYAGKSVEIMEGSSKLRGGEQEGLKHLHDLLKPDSSIYIKVSSRNSDPSGYISELSPWLSLGCLSPRMVYWTVKAAEDRYGSNANFSNLILGLFKRDYFRFMFKKHGASYLESATASDVVVLNTSFEQWKRGETGHMLVDGYMKLLADTGYLPNYGRVLAATFLVHVIKIDWMKGAAYFEAQLVDYTAASNWGNWKCIADSVSGMKSKNGFDVDKYLKILNIPAVA